MDYTRIPELISSYYNELSEISSEFPDIKEICNKADVDFQVKYQRANDKGRLLRLAVIGQVNAGKSTFLNTILFDGQEVLPPAATPKTANLTIISYDEKCRVEVEYYEEGDWKNLQNDAQKHEAEIKRYKEQIAANPSLAKRPFISNSETNKAAYELVQMAEANGLDVEQLISQKKEIVEFESSSDLCDHLDQYVGANGRLTPVTKAVRLYLNDERLKDLEIIDTPGLNDPVPARTNKTTQLMKTVDVAFFLSQTGGDFMNESDFNLLIRVFPSEGIKHIELIGSQLDSVLMEHDYDEYRSLNAALENIESRYNRQIRNILDARIKELETANPRIRELLANCYKPTYVSAMLYNMANKAREDYTEDEELIFDFLTESAEHWADLSLDSKFLISLSKIPDLVKKLESVRKDKTRILENSLRDLFPDETGKLTLLINDLRSSAAVRIEQLKSNDLDSLKNQEDILEDRISGIRAGIGTVFGDIIGACSPKAVAVRKDLMDELQNLATVKEKIGTREVEDSYEAPVSHSILGLVSWTTYETVYYTKSVSYRYASVNSALDNLNKAAWSASTAITKMFLTLIEQQSLRKDLLKEVMNNFDMDNETFSANYFKEKIQNAMNLITFPTFDIDVTNELNQIANDFPDPQYEDAGVDKLNRALSLSLNRLGNYIMHELDRKVIDFKRGLDKVKDDLCGLLIQSALQDMQKLKQDMENKEEKLTSYQRVIESCELLAQKISEEQTKMIK
jgi:GTPase SAR1 family protein